MALIGDYIHYNFQNYLHFGITKRPKVGGNKVPSTKIIDFPSMLNSALSQTIAASGGTGQDYKRYQELENKLNYFCQSNSIEGPSSNNIELSAQQMQEIKKALEEIMNESYSVAAYDFERTVGEMNRSGNNRKIKNIRDSKAGEKSGFNLKQLESRITQIESLARKVKGSLSEQKVAVVEGLLDNIEAQWLAIERMARAEAENHRGIIPQGGKTYGNLKSIQEDIKSVAREIYKKDTLSSMKGAMAENLTAIIAAVLESKTELTSEELINILKTQNLVVGQNRVGSTSVIKSSEFSPGVLNYLQSHLNDNYISSDGGLQWNLRGDPQGKVDVSLTFGGASVKNYNVGGEAYEKHGGITLLSNGNLFYMLTREPIFLNHYLNIAGTNSSHRGETNYLTMANVALKKLILMQAMSGIYDREKTADIFILNDNRTGRYKVYSVIDLLRKCAANLDLVTIKFNNKILDNGTTWPNTWVSGRRNESLANQRIANLLASLQVKVSVHAKIS